MDIVTWILCVLVLFFLAAMLHAAKLTVQRTIGGVISANQNTILSDNTGVSANPPVPAGQPGVLTTHTTNSTGTMTMTNSNHGLQTGQRVDIFWAGGACYGAVLGTVSGLTAPIASVSGGSNLPASLTAVTVGISTSAPFPCTGNNVQALAMSSPQQGYFVFNNGSSDVYAVLLAAGLVKVWQVGDPDANPLAGATPTVVYMSHSYTGGAITTMQAAAVTH